MYGTIARVRPKAGHEQDIQALNEEWDQIRRLKVKGARAYYVMRPDNRPGELIGVAVFADRASYRANAEDPEQHQWYLKFRELLEADPEWTDGEYITASSGNPDAERLVRENLAAFNAQDYEAGAQMIAPNAEQLDVPTGVVTVGPEGLKQSWQGWHTAFPDGRTEVLSVAATNDGTVVTEFLGIGTHNGPLVAPGGQQIPATGRSVNHRFCQVATVKDGKFTSARLYYDLAGLLAQLGIGG